MKYTVSFDPGETTGIAVWDEAGQLVWNGKLRLDSLLAWCEDFRDAVDIVVYEHWRIGARATKLKGSTTPAAEAIGVIRAFAHSKRAKMVQQGSNILRVAAMHMREKIPAKGHIDDALSAKLHGYYYLVSIGKRKTALQEENAAR